MTSTNIVVINATNFEQEVVKSATPVLVDFWGEHCAPCKMLAPILEELATEYDGKVRIAKVDVGEHQELAARFRIFSIPTLLFFKKGEVVDQVVGLKSRKELKTKLDTFAA